MRNCAYCGRENPDDAGQCRECGTALAAQPGEPQVRQPDSAENPARAVAEKRMLHGALWCIGGIPLTAFTHIASASGPGGGTDRLAWGGHLVCRHQVFL